MDQPGTIAQELPGPQPTKQEATSQTQWLQSPAATPQPYQQQQQPTYYQQPPQQQQQQQPYPPTPTPVPVYTPHPPTTTTTTTTKPRRPWVTATIVLSCCTFGLALAVIILGVCVGNMQGDWDCLQSTPCIRRRGGLSAFVGGGGFCRLRTDPGYVYK